MTCPNMEEEKRLWDVGYRFIAGLDECGRGSLVDDVVAACVLIPFKWSPIEGLKDSKKLSAGRREYLAKLISKECIYGIGSASAEQIDEIGIHKATEVAMIRAIQNITANKSHIDFILIDGPISLEIDVPHKGIIKGDNRCCVIAAASIVAKTYRDRQMVLLAEQYPEYGLDKNKGYGTKEHLTAIKSHGISRLHRKSFRPCMVKQDPKKGKEGELV